MSSLPLRPSMLVIDSRMREPGGSLDSFTVRLQPAITDISAIRLLYVSIGHPEDLVPELYWLIRVSQFGLGVRSAAGSDSASFIVLTNSAVAFRTLHRSQSDFNHIEVIKPSAAISSLDVSVILPGGGHPGLTDEWMCLIGLEY